MAKNDRFVVKHEKDLIAPHRSSRTLKTQDGLTCGGTSAAGLPNASLPGCNGNDAY